MLSKKIKNKIPDNIKKFIRRLMKPQLFYLLSNSKRPISKCYGFDRGKPIDRFYIESFLEENKNHIKGNCLELLDDNYTRKYSEGEVTKNDILDIEKINKNATIIDDIRNLKKIPDDVYDCIILTQVLQFIDDLDSAISECHRILKPEGVLLATLPSLSRVDCISGIDGDFWRFTKAGAEHLFTKKFNANKLEVRSYGNAKIGAYFFIGFAQEDIPSHLFKENDPDFPVIITVKATK